MCGLETGGSMVRLPSSPACFEWQPKLTKRGYFMPMAFLPDPLRHNQSDLVSSSVFLHASALSVSRGIVSLQQ
jgi:hypothetical protein